MTDDHVERDLSEVRLQAAIDQIRAEVRDLVGHIRKHRDRGCHVVGGACPGSKVITRLAAMACDARFDLAVAALITVAERDAEISALRRALVRRAAP